MKLKINKPYKFYLKRRKRIKKLKKKLGKFIRVLEKLGL